MRIACALLCALTIPQGGSVRRNQQPPTLAQRKVLFSQPALSPPVEAHLAAARRAFTLQDYREAEAHYLQALNSPEISADRLATARAKWGLGATYLASGDYARTIRNLVDARSIYESFSILPAVSAINGNLSSLYAQLGELETALEVGARSVHDLEGRDPPQVAAPLYLNLAIIQARMGRWQESIQSFTQGIESARRAGDREIEATGWDKLGLELLQAGLVSRAEPALVEAFRLRRLFRSPKLAVSRENVSLLKLEQGDFQTAASLLELPSGAAGAGWSYFYTRGRLHQKRGQWRAAIEDYRQAVEALVHRRQSLPAADPLRAGADWAWQRVPAALASAAAHEGARRQDAHLIEESFVTLEQHRARSLVERIQTVRPAGAMDETEWSARLRTAEESLASSPAALRQFRQARSAWLEAEDHPAPASLQGWRWQDLRRSLGPETALLSFYLDQPVSRLWVTTNQELRMISLPSRRRIEAWVREFRTEVESGARTPASGPALCNALFGQLPASVQRRDQWLLSLDEDLFEVPFAALPCGSGGPHLAETHTLRVIPGAGVLLASRPPWRPDGLFAGLGDPIYNLADPRSNSAGTAFALPGLNRLPGTANELIACAQTWPGPSQVLTGRQATRSALRRLLAADPAVIHLATHIVKPPAGAPVDAFIALSLSPLGGPQFVGQTEISATWRTRAALVVLSGCASGEGPTRRGVGLDGLTRAWLAAGAGSVVASYWPTPDNAAALFGEFYAALTRKASGGVAGALRTAQRRMIAAGDWRSVPRYWASYFVIGRW